MKQKLENLALLLWRLEYSKTAETALNYIEHKDKAGQSKFSSLIYARYAAEGLLREGNPQGALKLILCDNCGFERTADDYFAAGNILERAGGSAQAAAMYSRAILLEPGWKQPVNALNRLKKAAVK